MPVAYLKRFHLIEPVHLLEDTVNHKEKRLDPKSGHITSVNTFPHGFECVLQKKESQSAGFQTKDKILS